MNWGDAGAAVGGAAGGLLGGPGGAVTGAALGGGAGSWLDGSNPVNALEDAAGNIGNGIADWWKKRGPHGYQASGYNIDPNAFKNPDAAANNTAWGQAGANQAAASTNPGFFGHGQQDLASMLMAQANGQGPNLAEAQLKQATDRNLAQAAALGGSARGSNSALQARSVQNQQAGIAGEAAQASAATRMQEEENARNALGGVLSSGRSADLAGQGQANQAGQFYSGLGANQSLADFMAQQAGQQLQVQNALGSQAITSGAQTANNALGANFLGAGLNAAGGMIAALAEGGTVPGVDTGKDDKLIAARGGEVVVPPENPEYPAAKAAVSPAGGTLADHLARGGIYHSPHNLSPAAAPVGHPMGHRILEWLRQRNAGGGNQPANVGVGM